jgi:Tol biopolymer transport system component/DNA-binding winged helix-turn-helix (wHTH) protein
MEVADANRAQFGAFKLDLKAGEVSKGTRKILLQEQPFQILLMLVEHRGQVVTRDEIRKRLWPNDTVVEFDHSIQTAIRKLRQALGDSAENPKYIETVARRGYRLIVPVEWPKEPLGSDSSAPRSPDGSSSAPNNMLAARPSAGSAELEGNSALLTAAGLAKDREKRHRTASEMRAALESLKRDEEKLSGLRGRGWPLRLAAMVAMLVVALTVAWFAIHRTAPQPSPSRALTRLTFDSGLQFGATWSPDGRYIAYGSDRGGKFDIWVQRVGNNNPVRVTSRPGHNWQPDWSPDGRQIVFRGEGEGGGLFVVPALGGSERKIASFGYRPRWSPDGSLVLFQAQYLPTIYKNRVYLVSLDGSAPREILSAFFRDYDTGAGGITWFPDGKRVSFLGRDLSFWTVSLDGTAPVQSKGATEIIKQFDADDGYPDEFTWACSGTALYFGALSGGVENLWKVTVDPRTLNWGRAERLTTAPGRETNVAVSRDETKLAFTERTVRTRLWTFPFDAEHGRILAKGRPLTPPGIDVLDGQLSRDETKLVFSAKRAGNWELWEKSLVSGHETVVAADEASRSSARWSRDGTRLAYMRATANNKSAQNVVLSSAGNEQVLASYQAPWNRGITFVNDWSPNGDSVLVTGITHGRAGRNFEFNRAWGIWLLPIEGAPHAEARARLVAATEPGFEAHQASFSPDGRWIVFEASDWLGFTHSQICVVSTSGGKWIRLTDDKFWDDKPRWGSDGKSVYFISSRTGLFEVWGIHFDPLKAQPTGQPFRVLALDSPDLVIPGRESWTEITISTHRLIVPISEVSGSIWMLDHVDR